MKTPRDIRHQNRIEAVKELFTWEMQRRGGVDVSNFQSTNESVGRIIQNLAEIDGEIEKAASKLPLKQVNLIDLAILRFAIFELIIKKEGLFKVVVDEAVEIGKEFGGDSSPSFINGVLGNVISNHNLDKD
ncbi:hypothetical protein HY385_02985 [Candidatus Daviesbacteria bacterium]|nr:hypothetical protein [Candidatus Daviesbacteria bacterium]